MLKTCVIWFSLYLKFADVFGGHTSTQASIFSNPISSFLDKFYQNDYKVNYEWIETVRVNRNFMDYKTMAFKYNRTTTAINSTCFIKVDMGYDIEVIVQAYKFASNEYREFPMRFEVNLCESIKKSLYGSETFSRKNGNYSCPFLKGKRYVLFNWKPDESRFPPFIPNGKYMIEMQYFYHSDEILVTRDYGTVYRPITVYED